MAFIVGLNRHEKGSIVRVPVAAAEAEAAEAEAAEAEAEAIVVAVVTAAAGNMRPGPGQRRRACVSSINPLKMASRISSSSVFCRFKPARERLDSMCACTERDGSGIGAVGVECGVQTWPINMLTHTYTHKPIHYFKATYPRLRSDIKSV